jgi:hypothetical protein
MDAAQNICLNCGNGFSGNYCNLCGEKVYSAHDKKLSHLFEEIVHFITHFDTKFLRSVKLIFSKPGFVSKEFCEGRRSPYFKPVSLFLISIVIYLLFPLMQGMNISLGSHIGNNNQIHLYYSRNWALHKMEHQHLSEKELVERFDHVSPKVAKILMLLLLPLTALSLNLLFRNKKRYFFDHFILSTEFNSFFLLFFFILFPALILGISSLFHIEIDYGDSPGFLIIQCLLTLTMLILEFIRFYGVLFAEALVKALLFFVLFIICLFIYRQVIFIVVMLLI